MKRRLIAVVSLITLCAGFPGAAAAIPEERDERRDNFLERMAENLDLTEEQQARVREIHAEERQAVASLREQLEENREKIHALVTSFPFDEAAVRQLAERQADLRTDMIVSRARSMNRTLEVLTPEQRQEAERLFDRKKRRGGHRKGGMR